MKFRFWHKMTAIFGFLDEKCIEMEIFIITSWLFRIMTSLKLCQLYRDLYGKMAFWPQWRHQWEELKLQSPITREDKQLLRCVFFVRLVFMSTSKYLDRKKHGTSPLRELINKLRSIRKDCVTTEMTTHFILELATSPSLVCQANSFTLEKD